MTNFINVSNFDRHYNSDVSKWLEYESDFIDTFLKHNKNDEYIREINGDIWLRKEIAIKYAQTLDKSLEIACINVLGKFFDGYEKIEGSIFSFRFDCTC